MQDANKETWESGGSGAGVVLLVGASAYLLTNSLATTVHQVGDGKLLSVSTSSSTTSCTLSNEEKFGTKGTDGRMRKGFVEELESMLKIQHQNIYRYES